MDYDEFYRDIKEYLSCRKETEINDGLGIIQDKLLTLCKLKLHEANAIINKYKEAIVALAHSSTTEEEKEIVKELFGVIYNIDPNILKELQKTFKGKA